MPTHAGESVKLSARIGSRTLTYDQPHGLHQPTEGVSRDISANKWPHSSSLKSKEGVSRDISVFLFNLNSNNLGATKGVFIDLN